MRRRPPISTLFPYTTLFRSRQESPSRCTSSLLRCERNVYKIPAERHEEKIGTSVTNAKRRGSGPLEEPVPSSPRAFRFPGAASHLDVISWISPIWRREERSDELQVGRDQYS